MLEASDKVVLQRAFLIALAFGLLSPLLTPLLAQFPTFVQFLAVATTSYLLPSILVSGYLKWGSIINKKMLGTVSLFAAGDLISFPLLISFDGVYNASATTLGTASIDYNVLQLTQASGLAGFPLFFLTYAGGFVVLTFIGTWLLTDKMMWEILK